LRAIFQHFLGVGIFPFTTRICLGAALKPKKITGVYTPKKYNTDNNDFAFNSHQKSQIVILFLIFTTICDILL